jgi:hypothetical protein
MRPLLLANRASRERDGCFACHLWCLAITYATRLSTTCYKNGRSAQLGQPARMRDA